MTHSPTTDSLPSPLAPRIGLLGGRWTPQDQLALPIDDLGFRQGATAVERLRTYGGKIFQQAAHLDRWEHTVDEIGIDGLPLRHAIEVLSEELISRNEEFAEVAGDFGITMFATPGHSGDSDNAPTFCMHLNEIDHAMNGRRREHGQPLTVTDVSLPASNCWPRSIKVRCRLHYFLADQVAANQNQGALGVLVDQDGCVTDTSVANVAIVEQGHVVSPLAENVLGGITQQVIQSLAAQSSVRWSHEAITPQRLSAADEVLLMGTDGGIWFAHSVDGAAVGDSKPGPIYLQLRDAFDAICEEGN